MPQISKIRIVNFFFDNRLIPDELYDLSDEAGTKAFDTLISLRNGGGKSVLVQLMMQPVLPGAKVQDRHIEDYFTKSSDHAFVLLEWIKDNSPEKLLTGIAMAGSLSDSADTRRGRHIRYYTFVTNYTDRTNGINIIDLPLSDRTDGKFITADYEYIRKMSKKNNKDITIYSSDENREWREMLESYGIFQEEWRGIMEPLNSQEGGMSEFFKQFKTSDQLIDRLLIPSIENHLNSEEKRKDSSLSIIFANYVKKYNSQSKRLEERKLCERYKEDLSSLRTHVKELWDINDSLVTCISRMYGFNAALVSRDREFDKSIITIDNNIGSCENEIYHIRHENLSDQYYLAMDIADEERRKLEAAEKKEQEIKESLDNISHTLIVQEAARHYKKKRKAENELESYRSDLSEREHGEEGRRLNALGASVRISAEEELDRCKDEKSRIESEICEASKRHLAAEKERKQAEKAKDEAYRDFLMKTGGYSQYCKETDEKLNSRGIDMIRNHFTDRYDETELSAYLEGCESSIMDLTDKIKTNCEKSDEIQKELDSIPFKKAELILVQKEHYADRQKAQQEQEIFLSLKDKLLEICIQYSLSPNSIYTRTVVSYLNEQQTKITEKIHRASNTLLIKRDELKAAENGCLHISKTITDFLDSSGIDYEYCEKYLLSQIMSGNMDPKKCHEILSTCPSVAYGIMLDSKNMELLNSLRPEWFPAVLPVFSMMDVERILNMSYTNTSVLAFYSEKSFADRNAFIDELKAECKKAETEITRWTSEGNLVKEQLELCDAFQYDKDWEYKQEKLIDRLTEQLHNDEQTYAALEEDEKSLISVKESLTEQILTLNEKLSSEREQKKALNEISERLVEEQRQCDERNDSERSYNDRRTEYEAADKDFNSAQERLDTLNEEGKRNLELINKLMEAIREVGDRTSEEPAVGVWIDLFEQFKMLQSSQNDDIQRLNDKINERLQTISDEEKEIERTGCTLDEYKNIPYDEAIEQNHKNKKANLEKDREAQQTIVKELTASHAKSAASLESIIEKLTEFDGHPLEKTEIKGDYLNRSKKAENHKSQLSENRRDVEKEKRRVEMLSDKVNDYLRDIPPIEKATAIELSAQIEEQWSKYRKEYTDINKSSREKHTGLTDKLRDLKNEYPESVERTTIVSMSEMLGLPSGDVYISLDRQIDAALHASSLRLKQIDTDLEDFDNTRNDLIHQCKLQGQRIFTGLLDIEKKARIKLDDNRAKQELIRLGLPADVDENASLLRLSEELDKSVKELAQQLDQGIITEDGLEKASVKAVSSSILLRRYIGEEQISLNAYKFDSDSSRREYRTWESTAKDNSGAEKFLVYFAVILSLIHYARSDTGDIKNSTGVLLLDNPFGVITSPHALDAMFKMLRHFDVQLICLSDITKCDITACFSIHIKAAVKTNSLSHISILSHEGNERIEHGYCRTEQIRLL